MNDTLKFRVWDKRHRTYEHDSAGAYFIDMLGDLIFIKEEDDNEDRVQGENFMVERCTGLTDRNGKLIFEGDVVRYYRSTAMGLGGERIASVRWNNKSGYWYILTTLGDGYDMYDALQFGIEIIGNVHEMEVAE